MSLILSHSLPTSLNPQSKLIARMSGIDRQAALMGIPGLSLMESAGQAVARKVLSWLDEAIDPAQSAVLILCGPGNNGGDGLACAKHLAIAGVKNITVWRSERPLTGDAEQQLIQLQVLRFKGCFNEKIWKACDSDKASTFIASATESSPSETLTPSIIIDAIFGSGLNKPVEGLYCQWIGWANQCRQLKTSRVLAVDIPSGINSRTGKALGKSIQADITLALACPKPGLYLHDGPQHAGTIKIADIGIPLHLIEADPGRSWLMSFETAQLGLPKRPKAVHKYDVGKVLVIAGSEAMPGAARLSAQAALVAGAGLVTLASPKRVFETMDFPPEIMRIPLGQTEEGTIAATALDERLKKQITTSQVVVVGPGLSTAPNVKAFFEELLLFLIESASCRVVLDGDALTLLSQSDLRNRLAGMEISHRFILTPHLGEARRLAATSGIPQDAEEDLCDYAMALSRALQSIIALKSAAVILSDGQSALVNTTGNSGMAAGGSGDVLSGLIAGLLAQQEALRQRGLLSTPVSQAIDSDNAIVSAIYLHGLAGDLAKAARSEYCLSAQSLIDYLPQAFQTLLS